MGAGLGSRDLLHQGCLGRTAGTGEGAGWGILSQGHLSKVGGASTSMVQVFLGEPFWHCPGKMARVGVGWGPGVCWGSLGRLA